MSIEPLDQPIGSRYHPEFRDLDPRRLPVAPPRPGQAQPQPKEATVNMTARIVDCLKAHATSVETALKSAEIASKAGLDEEPSAIKTRLRMATKTSLYPLLQVQTRGNANYWWYGEPAADAPAPAAASRRGSIDRWAALGVADSVLRELSQVGQESPRWVPDAGAHAARLRQLSGLSIWPEAGSTVTWLNELADLIEFGGAA